MPNVYLDHSATTPVDPRVLEAMLPYFTQSFGNASSGHGMGRAAEDAVESARETIAGVLNCRPAEIVFTSGGTESDNIAVRGAAWAARERGRHLITTPLEHGAVGKTVEQLTTLHDFTSTILPVDTHGLVSPVDFLAACRPDTTLASVIYANNEVGTIQPIAELAALARAQGILFHTDAVQAAGQLTLDVQKLGVDLLSLSGHKFYGPKGVGALFVREGVKILSPQTGGSQEHNLRAGTHNTPGIVGLAEALRIAYADLEARTQHYAALRSRLISEILRTIPGAVLTGHPIQRLPSHASFVFRNSLHDNLLAYLDERGIAASAASACKTGSPKPSGVLLALGYDSTVAARSLRLTVGLHTTQEDIDYTVNTLKELLHWAMPA